MISVYVLQMGNTMMKHPTKPDLFQHIMPSQIIDSRIFDNYLVLNSFALSMLIVLSDNLRTEWFEEYHCPCAPSITKGSEPPPKSCLKFPDEGGVW